MNAKQPRFTLLNITKKIFFCAVEHRQKAFLSNAEISFYHVLRLCITDDLALFAKPRVTDLLSVVSKDRKAQLSQFNRLSKKHVDFVLCDARSLTLQLVIEFDDSSRKQTKRQERDALVDDAFAAAQIRMLRVPALRNYSPAELKQQIAIAINEQAR